MAIAARSSRANPDLGDARTPCPACGQPIHPVAGRCKHCKTDLVKLRAQQGDRAARVAPSVLHAAAAPPSPYAPPAPASHAPPSPYAPPAPSPFAPPPAAAPSPYAPGAPRADATPPPALPPLDGSAPVPEAIGPYPGLVDAAAEAAAERGRSRWPLVVAVLAGVAIVVCVILLVFDDQEADAGDRPTQRRPAPAPDRMDTSPALPRPDPWDTPHAPQDTAPSRPAPVPPDPIPVDPMPLPGDPDDLDDPFANGPDPYGLPSTPPRRYSGPLPSAEDFTEAWVDLFCKRLQGCGFVDQVIGEMCSALAGSGMTDLNRQAVRAGLCTYDEAAANTCLATIDAFDCQGGNLDLQAVMGLADLTSCMSALRCR